MKNMHKKTIYPGITIYAGFLVGRVDHCVIPTVIYLPSTTIPLPHSTYQRVFTYFGWRLVPGRPPLLTTELELLREAFNIYAADQHAKNITQLSSFYTFCIRTEVGNLHNDLHVVGAYYQQLLKRHCREWTQKKNAPLVREAFLKNNDT